VYNARTAVCGALSLVVGRNTTMSAIAFNPSITLLEMAQHHGWQHILKRSVRL
jgi:hypothetical protein